MPHRVAFLNCEDAAKWADHADVWRQALMPLPRHARDEDGDIELVEYRAFAGELPSLRELDQCGAMVVPGSHHTAAVGAGLQPAWIEPTKELLRTVVRRRRPRIFGACFGHQLVRVASTLSTHC